MSTDLKNVVRKKNRHFELQLTAMIDMLMIILVFLIKSTTIRDVSQDFPSNIRLPTSLFDNPASQMEAVVISKTGISYNNQELVPVRESSPGDYYIPEKFLADGKLVQKLYNALVSRRDSLKAAGAAGGQENFIGTVNIVADKEVSYRVIRRVLDTAAQAEFKDYNLVVVNVQ